MKAFLLLFGLLALGSCQGDKPSEQECERVIAHIRRLNGNQLIDVGADAKSMVRSCRANSSKDTVNCMLAAKSLPELQKCEKSAAAQP